MPSSVGLGSGGGGLLFAQRAVEGSKTHVVALMPELPQATEPLNASMTSACATNAN